MCFLEGMLVVKNRLVGLELGKWGTLVYTPFGSLCFLNNGMVICLLQNYVVQNYWIIYFDFDFSAQSSLVSKLSMTSWGCSYICCLVIAKKREQLDDFTVFDDG